MFHIPLLLLEDSVTVCSEAARLVVLPAGARSIGDVVVVDSRKTVMLTVIGVSRMVLSAGACVTTGALVLKYEVGRHISASPFGLWLNDSLVIERNVVVSFSGKA